MGRMKRFFLSVFALFLLGLIFWRPIGGFLAHQAVQIYCRASLEADFSCEALLFDGTRVAFENPRIEGRSGWSLEAERLSVDYSLSLFSRTINSRSAVNGLKISVEKIEKLRPLIRAFAAPAGFWKQRPTLLVEKGELAAEGRRLRFEGVADLSEYRELSAAVGLGDAGFDSNAFLLALKREEEGGFSLSLEFKELELEKLSALASLFLPDREGWRLERGVVDGAFTVKRGERRPLHAEGELKGGRIAFSNPLKGIAGELEEAALVLKSSENSSSLGSAAFSGGSFSSLSGTFENLLGNLQVDRHGEVELAVEGLLEQFPFHVAGQARLFDITQPYLNLHWSLQGEKEGRGNFALRQFGGGWNLAELKLEKLGAEQFRLAQKMVRPYLPELSSLTLESGELELKAAAYLKGGRLHDLKISGFTLSDFKGKWRPLKLRLQAERLTGGLAVDLSGAQPYKSLDAELKLSKGALQLGGLWELGEIEADLAVSNGLFEKSVAEGEFAGLRGTIEMDWLSTDKMMSFRFSGGTEGLAPFLPELVGKGLRQGFSDDTLSLTADMRRAPEGAVVSGVAAFEDRFGRGREELEFGFSLEGVKRQKKLSLAAMRHLMTALERPAALLLEKREGGEPELSGLALRRGWFRGENLPAEKFVAPFAFQPDEEGELPYRFYGLFDIDGCFDGCELAVGYRAHNFLFEGEMFKVEIEEFPETPAVHYVDFGANSHFGIIPIRHALYLEKETGLVFTDVCGKVYLEGEQVHVREAETFCAGAYFAGDIELDYANLENGAVDVVVSIEAMHGKLSQLQLILSHLEEPPAAVFLPLEGDVRLRDGGGHMHFMVRPEQTHLLSRFDGELANGALTWKIGELSLQEVGFNFNFDHLRNSLEVTDIQGTLLVGRPGSVEEYLLAGDKVHVYDYENRLSRYDLWIGDKNRDILRIVGNSEGKIEEGKEHVSFTLDREQTHFGDVHPERFALTMKNMEEVEAFALDFNLRLETVYRDLQRLVRSELFSLPELLFQELGEQKGVGGRLAVRLGYDSETAAFTYHAEADRLTAGSKWRFESCLLNGKVKDRTWSIDQLQLDELSVATEFARQEDLWKVSFLGLRMGKSLLLGLEGCCRDGEPFFAGKINLLELDLSRLSEWPKLKELVAGLSPEGDLHATGSFKVEMPCQGSGWRFEALLSAGLKNWGLCNEAFTDAENFSCHFVSGRGVTVRELHTALKIEGGQEIPLAMERLHTPLSKEAFEIEGVRFSLQVADMPLIKEKAQLFFADVFNPVFFDTFAGLKNSGKIEGSAGFSNEEGRFCCSLALDDGRYRFAGREHPVKNFHLIYEPDRRLAEMLYLYERTFYKLQLHAATPDLSGGTLLISDLDAGPGPLRVNWSMDPQTGFTVERAEGALKGLELHLARDRERPLDSDYWYFAGKATLGFPDAASLFSEYVETQLREAKAGGSYSFEGKWAFGRNPEEPLRFFSGMVEGSEVSLKGYRFDALRAQLNETASQAVAANIEIFDPSGRIKIPELMVTKGEFWRISIPKATAEEFRPSLLKEAGMRAASTKKALVISRLDLNNIEGYLNDQNSLRGKGRFVFSNPSRSPFQNTIFAIPAEIITRIGLNPAVLTPVKGTVLFHLGEGKVFLEEFKDVYSESRASKFYIPAGSRSYIDFDGNIRMQVRMKQYNLLFKLAELFTVTIGGSLEHPTYTLQKQEKKR